MIKSLNVVPPERTKPKSVPSALVGVVSPSTMGFPKPVIAISGSGPIPVPLTAKVYGCSYIFNSKCIIGSCTCSY